MLATCAERQARSRRVDNALAQHGNIGQMLTAGQSRKLATLQPCWLLMTLPLWLDLASQTSTTSLLQKECAQPCELSWMSIVRPSPHCETWTLNSPDNGGASIRRIALQPEWGLQQPFSCLSYLQLVLVWVQDPRQQEVPHGLVIVRQTTHCFHGCVSSLPRMHGMLMLWQSSWTNGCKLKKPMVPIPPVRSWFRQAPHQHGERLLRHKLRAWLGGLWTGLSWLEQCPRALLQLLHGLLHRSCLVLVLVQLLRHRCWEWQELSCRQGSLSEVGAAQSPGRRLSETV
mmetsp:Transcript_10479/g.23807  ORF Transcript_10479/g.23807 Transcript_10479/m.23807 type:complete len:286 (+) Transcript_10479:434-1291(+)